MFLTMNDWLMLVGMLSFAGFISFLSYHVTDAIHNYLHG